ncbi:MAG: polysaccharide pyruvyl transferase family protein [Synergistaceae bacterium]|nr:polysaccharide pyruvyl transferase family protein [Synergistaceae bacterium]
MNKIHFVSAFDRRNTGDWVTSPLNYYYGFFKQYSVIAHDILTVHWAEIYKDDIVIIGGGGMLDLCDEWNMAINKLTEVCENVVVWSAGFNRHYNEKLSISLKTERFKLCGVRDFNLPGFEWLPCVTCKLPELDKKLATKRYIGVISHHGNLLPGFTQYERITNGQNIYAIIDFISSSDIIVSNSYHALYFTMLMQKKAVCSNKFSTKFENFKYKPAYYSGDIEADAEKAQVYDREEARKLNDKFFESVKAFVEAKIQEPDNSYTQIYMLKRQSVNQSKDCLLKRLLIWLQRMIIKKVKSLVTLRQGKR